jgi:inner membrane protein
MIEINNKQNIHPIQYLLVGFSLCLFYGLLISFSELMDFNISYLIAAIMTSSMISIYIYSVLKQIKFAAITGISLAGIYTYLYIILQQEDYALLIGNLGLFIILGIIMYFSRKIQFSLN